MMNLMSREKLMKIMLQIILEEVMTLSLRKKNTGNLMRGLTDTERFMKKMSYPSL